MSARESGDIGSDEPNMQAGVTSGSGAGGCDGGGNIQAHWTLVHECRKPGAHSGVDRATVMVGRPASGNVGRTAHLDACGVRERVPRRSSRDPGQQRRPCARACLHRHGRGDVAGMVARAG